MKTTYRRAMISLFSVLMVIVLVPGAMAEKPKGEYGKRSKYGQEMDSAARILKHGEALHLSDQQRKDLKAMSIDFKKKKIRLKADIAIAELEMGELVYAENLSEDKLFAKVEERGKLKTTLMKEEVRVKLAARKVLTKEQRSQMHKQMAGAGAHRKGKPGLPHKKMQGHPK